jgi:uncharacterized membrane protein YdjX (TVP38/TMEM64 family)
MKHFLQLLPLVVVFTVSFFILYWDAPVLFLEDLLHEVNLLSYLAYVLLLITAVVFMPLTAMPVIAIAAGLMDPFIIAILSIVGWTVGAAIAFLIARYFGRVVIEDYVDVSKIDVYLDKIPKGSQFWFIVVLRITLPVDIVSYALGLTKSLNFYSYIGATAVGVSWFSFAFAYLGNAFLHGNILIILEIALASLCVFICAWYFLHSKKGDK